MDTMRVALCVTLLALGAAAPAAHAVQGNVAYVGPSQLAAVSDDGARVLLETAEPLATQDTDAEADVYAIDAGSPQLLSIGSAGGNAPLRPVTFEAASADGARVLFTTREALVPEDTDAGRDIYEHSGGTTRLLTAAESSLLALTADGTRVFFSTAAALTPDDGDATVDIYEEEGGTVRLVSVGPDGADVASSTFAGISTDGTRVWFETREPLSAADDDATGLDVYERSAGTTSLVTDWPGTGGGAEDASFEGASDSGDHIFVRTAGAVTADDTDMVADVFDRTPSGTTLVSTGPADAPGGAAAQFLDASPDGTRAYFSVPEVLVAARPGGVFERAAGVTTWLGSDVPSLVIAADSTATYFVTPDALVPEDTNPGADVYLRAAGGTQLVSNTFAASGPRVAAVSSDGERVFFTTASPLDAQDADSALDLYALDDGVLYLMSGGPAGWPAAPPGLPRIAIVPSGARVLFETFDRLTALDGDTELDVYAAAFPERSGYPRPKSASALTLSLVPAYVRCTAPNSTHGPPLEFGSCAPPVREPGRLTVGTPDANGEGANAAGRVRLALIAGDLATAEDEADVRIAVHDSDVREAQDLADYTGELELSLRLRITDRDGSAPPTVPMTMGDTELSIPVPCTATPDAAVGATCALDSTVDAVVPGAVVENHRIIWAHQAVRVFDGGADGQAGTLEDNSLFQVPGVFLP